jgi:hypothetical protein
MYSKTREARRQAEIEKGQQIGARAFIDQTFNPEAPRPNSGIDAETRRQRDEYRNRMGAQVDKS